MPDNKQLKVVFSPEARTFFNELGEKAKKKLDTNINKTKKGYKGDWFKKLVGTEGIYEFSADADNHFYRLFAFWDKSDNGNTLIVCTHGIEKKTNKTPDAAIEKAEKMKKDWFAAKQKR